MLSAFIGLGLAFFIPVLLGFLTLRFFEVITKTPISHRLPNLVACAAGSILGWVLITFCLRFQHTLGLPASRLYTLAIPLALSVALLALLGRRAHVASVSRTHARSVFVSAGAVAITLLTLPLLLEVGLQPLPGWDAWEFWAARAKVWFFTGDLADNRLLRNEDYPPAVSLMMLWVARAAGAWRDDLFSYISVFHLLSAGVVMYWALARRASRWAALVGIALALGAPLIAVHAVTGGYADLPLACALVVATSLLINLHRPALQSQYLVPLALALCLPFYKIPGLFWLAIFLAGAATFFVADRHASTASGSKWVRYAGLLVALALAAVVMLVLRSPAETLKIGNYSLKLGLNDGAFFVFNELFVTGSFLLLWLGLTRYITTMPRRDTPPLSAEIRALNVIVALGLAFVLAAVFLSNNLEWWADGSTLNRALIHLAPTGILLLIVKAYSTLTDEASSPVKS
jgi:hypothetical protein